MAAVTIHSDSGAQESKVCHCFHCFPICHEVMGPDAMILVHRKLSLKSAFLALLYHLYQEALQFLFAFYHKGGVICISDVTDISPGNLDFSL